MATPRTLRVLFLKILSAPLKEWDFDTVQERDAWLAKQLADLKKATAAKKAKAAKPKSKPKPARVPFNPSSR